MFLHHLEVDVFAPRRGDEAQGAAELLPRYGVDNLFVADSFTCRFPDFRVTTIDEGLSAIRDERRAAAP